MAQYAVTYQPDGRRRRQVGSPRLFETSYRSRQPTLWELSDAEWHKVLRLPDSAPRRLHPEPVSLQLPLFA